MGLEWSDRLTVGHALIDEQHRELIRRFTQFLEACQQTRARGQLEPLLLFLDSYVTSHFREEERLMKRHAYPDAEAHFAAHRQIEARLGDLREELRNDGISSALIIQTNQTLLEWVVRHIQQTDLQLGNYLKRVGAVDSAGLSATTPPPSKSAS